MWHMMEGTECTCPIVVQCPLHEVMFGRVGSDTGIILPETFNVSNVHIYLLSLSTQQESLYVYNN